MSVHTYTRPTTGSASTPAHNDWQAIIGHGAGSLQWKDKYPVTQYLFNVLSISTVHSLLQPFHGSDSGRPIDEQHIAGQACDVVYDLLAPLIRTRKHTLVVAYSASSLLLLRVWSRLQALLAPNQQLYAVFLGSALTNNATNCAGITRFWKPSSFSDRQQAMVRQHGDSETVDDEWSCQRGWVNTVHAAALLTGRLRKDGGLFLDDAERQHHFPRGQTSQSNIYFISGKDEEPFPPNDTFRSVLDRAQLAQHLRVVDCRHWNYFEPNVFPTIVQPALTSIVVQHLPQLVPQFTTPLPEALIRPTITNNKVQTYVRPDCVNVSDSQFDERQQWQAVVMSGGGQLRWNDEHVVTKLLLEYCPIIHSLELPLHGNNRHDINTFNLSTPTAEGLRHAWAMLAPLLRRGRRTLFVGYSMSSLTLLKLYPQLESIVTGGDTSAHAKRQCALLLFGTSLGPPTQSICDTIFSYWMQGVEDVFGTLMHKQHGKAAFDVQKVWIAEVSGKTDSGFWLDQSERQALLNDSNRRVYLINGEKETFSIDDCILPYVTDEWTQQRRLYRIPNATHIDYFQKQKFWPGVSRCIRAIMMDGLQDIQWMSPAGQPHNREGGVPPAAPPTSKL